MAFTPTPGRLAVLKVTALDISLSCKTSALEESADVYDTSGYGVTNRTKVGGILDGKFTASGSYDIGTVTGTAIALEGQRGNTLALILQILGTGTTKPQDVFSAVLSKFTKSVPVDEIVTWAAEFEITGPIVRTVQP
jgi:hypothetical protein